LASLADEPFLEAALDDKSIVVRRAASDLPDSAFLAKGSPVTVFRRVRTA
jgi:hypothetical protein